LGNVRLETTIFG